MADPQSAPGLNNMQRSPDLWLDDGNIILVARDPLQNQDIGFRVHKSVLARHSTVFKDMFAIPQPIQGEVELYQGIPVVKFPELAQELAYILNIMYDGGSTFYNHTIPLPFPEAITALTLGSKYFLDSIREEALRRFAKALPTARNRFFAAITAIDYHTYPSQRPHNARPVLPVDMLKSNAIAVVNVAKALGLTHLLPAAYFLCSQLPFQMLIGGVVDDFGREQKLSPDDLALCLTARDEFHRGGSGAIGIILDAKPHPACSEKGQCLTHFREAVGGFFRDGQEDHRALFDENFDFIGDLPACDPCFLQFIDICQDRLDDIWRQLGPKFNVAPWPPQTQTQDQMETDD